VYSIHEKKQLIKHLQNSGVDVYSEAGPAQFIDTHTISLNGNGNLYAEKFILCVGGHARQLELPGVEHTITHSEVWSLKSAPQSVVILGASATGCQLASILSAFGCKVFLFDRATRILTSEDEQVSEAIADSFMHRGIEITTDITEVDRIEKDNGYLVFNYTHNNQSERIIADQVVLAAGWTGNLEGLNLEAANVVSERGFIKVDDYLCTSSENIYAAGDITGRMMLVQSGGYEGRIAAENAVLGPAQPYQHQIVPHGGFTDPEYGSVGLTEKQVKNAGIEYVKSVVSYATLDRAVIDDHTEGFCKLIVSLENHRILGAHIVGEQALEIVQMVAAGMTTNMWIEQFAELELAYPTYTAIVGLAARQLVQQLGVMPLTPQWRALGLTHTAEWEHSEP
jgi:dihydrolipoamide dehydrogenase